MVAQKATDAQIVAALKETNGSRTAAAQKLGVNVRTIHARVANIEGIVESTYHKGSTPGLPPQPQLVAPDGEAVAKALRKAPAALTDLAQRLKCTPGQALDAIYALRASNHNVAEIGGKWTLSGPTHPAFMRADDLPTYTSRPDGTYVFGACGDNHLGSKYSRLDVLNHLYDRYAEEGVDRVYNTGNWIDGEARFNEHDLLIHGMDAQLRYLAKHYPQRPGIHTYAVAGDDHEGWYAQKMGIEIGRRAEDTMREEGRTDWHDLGYMEAHIRLIHAKSGKEAVLAVVHPGGGSSYAHSYVIQKIIESYEGGEKPAVALYGHYHKLWFGNIRNVWAVQTGTTEDQTTFMRKKRLEAHVGGTLLRMRQDPESGAIISCSCEIMKYFNKGFYNHRWSHGGDVTHAERSP